jgi:hypothetical protein
MIVLRAAYLPHRHLQVLSSLYDFLEKRIVTAELLLRPRAVNDRHVDVVEPHRLERAVNRCDRCLVRLDARDLHRGDEYLLSVDAMRQDSVSDAAIVGIGLSRTD